MREVLSIPYTFRKEHWMTSPLAEKDKRGYLLGQRVEGYDYILRKLERRGLFFRQAMKEGDDALKHFIENHYAGAGWKSGAIINAGVGGGGSSLQTSVDTKEG
jgi:hypothetical protein